MQKFQLKIFATDELSHGLLEMIRTKKPNDWKIPTWLPFAATCLLDIHHMMREKVNLGFTRLQTIGRLAKGKIDRYFEFSNSMPRPDNFPAGYKKMLLRYQTEINDSILTDRIFALKEAQWSRVGFPLPGNSERFYLLKRQPIFCGILACRTLYEVQNAGMAVCKIWGTVSHPAQLYMVLRNANLAQSWPMMEKVMKIQTKERIFLGGAPENIRDSYKQTMLMLGYSTTTFASNKREGDLNGTFGAYNNDRYMFDIGDFEGLLGNEAMLSKLEADPKHGILKELWTDRKVMTPMQMLLALRLFVSVEVPKLRFDYFNMHEQSIQLLRMLAEDMDQDFRKLVGPWYLEDETELPYIALYVIAVETREGVREEPKFAMLEKAAGVFEKFIEQLE